MTEAVPRDSVINLGVAPTWVPLREEVVPGVCVPSSRSFFSEPEHLRIEADEGGCEIRAICDHCHGSQQIPEGSLAGAIDAFRAFAAEHAACVYTPHVNGWPARCGCHAEEN